VTMFKKVLIAEDIDTINNALGQILNEFGIIQIDHVKYCDDALLKIKKALADNEPYDLFISDLSFETDYRAVQIKTGEEAIAKIRALQPNLKIIVYSVEDKSFRIKKLFVEYKINGYIHKGRKSINQFKYAIQYIYDSNVTYISPEMEYIFNDKTNTEIDDFDIQILKQLSKGVSQEEMEGHFKELGMTQCSKSKIEKRIGRLKEHFRANNTVHLIAIAKDLGIA